MHWEMTLASSKSHLVSLIYLKLSKPKDPFWSSLEMLAAQDYRRHTSPLPALGGRVWEWLLHCGITYFSITRAIGSGCCCGKGRAREREQEKKQQQQQPEVRLRSNMVQSTQGSTHTRHFRRFADANKCSTTIGCRLRCCHRRVSGGHSHRGLRACGRGEGGPQRMLQRSLGAKAENTDGCLSTALLLTLD